MARDARLVLVLIGFTACCLVATSWAQPAEVKVGLIIDADSPVGKIATTTIPMALEDFYAAFPNSTARLKIMQYNSSADVVIAASAGMLMTTQGARAILGPRSSVESAFVADLATHAEVPVVSFSATSPSVSPTAARFFSRAAHSDADQAGAIAALATLFGWRRVVPIYQDDDYGVAFLPFLVDALASARAEVPYRCALSAATSPDAVAAELYRLESEQTRVFVLHTRHQLARRVFAAALKAGMTGEGYVWVITDGLTGLLGSVQPPQGVIGLAPYVPTTPRLRDVKKRWAHRYMRDHPDGELSHAIIGCYAVWAYDAAWAVASAAERLSATDLSSPPGLVGGTDGDNDISGLGKSRSGKSFLRALSGTKFEGLGGRFELVDGELVVPAYRVLNIIEGGKERGIGFWSPRFGLSRHISRRSDIPGGELAPVIWPGESAVQPSGWVQPTSARKLRVAVPGYVSASYRAIVHLDVDPVTNQTTAGGFVIDVFEAAVRLLPYALPFEYVKAKSQPYDTLVHAVQNGAHMVIKMLLIFVLVLMDFCAWPVRLKLETLPLEVLDVLDNFAWKIQSWRAQAMTKLFDDSLKKKDV
ncbi:glutamate receptor 2.8-like [Lolium rigidum]|uniref:glutamate receptor 2.8-like n=1 Tax=Lolium rigidum TaxID=89674 RepID=UPI001F5C5D90|nr:glutamate receptor 2.8-like [Lolium rigidum]